MMVSSKPGGKIDVKALKAELEKHKAEREKNNRLAREARTSAPKDAPARVPGPTYRGQSYEDFSDLLGAEEFRSLVVRDGGGEFRFTLKAVFHLPKGPFGVYMHGAVKNKADLPALLDRLVRKGDWHEDKYYKPE